jgi:acetylornithine deacetylase/succinyl-diaminopimelate desuccinylase-like protein
MNIKDLDLNLLRLFDAVWRSRSVSLAAQQLGMSQPAASQGLARLRGMLGDALFERSGAGVRPTPRADRLAQAHATAAILGDEIYKRFPWAHYDCGGATSFTLPTTTDPVEALLQRTWRPTLSVTGAEGFPALKDAGNVLRPYTAFKLSLRLPPLIDAAQAVQELKTLLEDNAPYQAKVTFQGGGATGWNAPDTMPWFDKALDGASQAFFGAGCGTIGQGGTIPLMNMLSQGFPKAQMMVCGVLGPKSNAHGPNEFLHVPYAKKLTAAVAEVIARMP